ncbi:hypothetical protein HYDPIDRAFT_30372, partial [Hydnomerulius pinastri MD-312]
KQWSSACSTSWFPFEIDVGTTSVNTSVPLLFAVVSLFAFGMFALSAFMKHSLGKRTKQYNVTREDEAHDSFINEKSRLLP